MAYPFVPTYPLGEFIRIVCEQWDGKVLQLPNGGRYLRRVVPEGRVVGGLALKPGKYFTALPRLPDEARLGHDVVRSLCCALGIPPQSLGYTADPPLVD